MPVEILMKIFKVIHASCCDSLSLENFLFQSRKKERNVTQETEWIFANDQTDPSSQWLVSLHAANFIFNNCRETQSRFICSMSSLLSIGSNEYFEVIEPIETNFERTIFDRLEKNMKRKSSEKHCEMIHWNKNREMDSRSPISYKWENVMEDISIIHQFSPRHFYLNDKTINEHQRSFQFKPDTRNWSA